MEGFFNMKTDIKIKYLPEKTKCVWHKDEQGTGRLYTTDDLLTSGVCPIMFHTLYPYFLGSVFGAKYAYNKQGDCQVCCPAEKGVDVLVKVRPYDEKFEEGVPTNWRDVIHAEVVKVNGPCDYNHKVGDRFVFPTCMKEKFACPAGLYNLYPFLEIEMPKCINRKRLRCPDWLENVYYSIAEEDLKEIENG